VTFPSRLRRQNLKTEFARHLRSEMTDAERRFWAVLRSKQIAGLRFRRQQPVGPYVADFYCSAAKLVIELDGDQHGADRAMAYDDARTNWLETHGYHVLRFPNRDAYNSRAVVDAIVHFCVEHDIPLPENASGVFDPPSRGG
jgi:very-short-patch-repair endonuclease